MKPRPPAFATEYGAYPRAAREQFSHRLRTGGELERCLDAELGPNGSTRGQTGRLVTAPPITRSIIVERVRADVTDRIVTAPDQIPRHFGGGGGHSSTQ
jgi:hypothetical protein